MRNSRNWFAQTVLAAAAVGTASPAAANEPLNWHVEYAAAWKAMSEQKQPLLLYLKMERCPFCDRMERESFQNPELAAQLSELYVLARLHRKDDPQLAKQLGVTLYPSTIIIDDGKIVGRIDGYVSPAQLRARLSTIRTAARSGAAR